MTINRIVHLFTQELKTKNALVLLKAVSSIVDPLFNLMTSDLKSINQDSLSLLMNSILSITALHLLRRTKPLRNVLPVPLTTQTMRMSFLPPSATNLKDVRNKIKRNLLSMAFDTISVIEKNKSSVSLDVFIIDTCFSMVRIASDCGYQDLSHFVVETAKVLTSIRNEVFTSSFMSNEIAWKKKSQVEDLVFPPAYMMGFLRILLALISYWINVAAKEGRRTVVHFTRLFRCWWCF